MKILMTGGTGFVGSRLTGALCEDGHRLTVLTRSVRPDRALPSGAVFLEADPTEPGPWQEQVPEHDLLINLAGASIFQRWTDKAKKRMRESRLRTTRNLVDALAGSEKGGSIRLLNTSAVGYYGFAGDEILTEESPPGDDFLAVLARDWEREALRAGTAGARVTILRFGVVLGGREGALAKMVPLFKKYLGGPLGSGDQWFPWIHIQDLVSVYRFLMDRPDLEGPLNCTAPQPVRNRELTRALAGALEKPAFMPPVPGFVIRAVLGEFGNVLLKGQRVIPERLIREGFAFRYPAIEEALNDLVG
ncbi:MAG: TIGR01777 family oxidoreductase [Deltaproteobacteria bacterium]|nr:TIGR01777 family oxidoreductase [Deltaproteobacteria bacterium]